LGRTAWLTGQPLLVCKLTATPPHCSTSQSPLHRSPPPQEGNGAAARANGNGAAAKAAPAGDSDDEELVENNPELHPLKEALQRARMRLEEATGIRWAQGGMPTCSHYAETFALFPTVRD